MREDKTEIFIGEHDVYLIRGLDLDVEFDYISDEERTNAILELEEYIQEQDIEPVQSDNGYINVHEDTIIYDVKDGGLGYASSFENNPTRDPRTEHVLGTFYDNCFAFWNREQDKGSSFELANTPERLAMHDASLLERDPAMMNGELIDKDIKLTWLKEKEEELDVLEKPTVVLDKQTGGYSIHTNLKEMFEACKQNTLDNLAAWEDEYNAQLKAFEQFSLEDKNAFVTDNYEYALLEPTQENVKDWENFHYTNWQYDIAASEPSEARFLEKLENHFIVHEHEEGYELETWTDGGVNMIITLHKDHHDSAALEDQFKQYVHDFIAGDEIRNHQEDASCMQDFRFHENIHDFEAFHNRLKDIQKDVCSEGKQQSNEKDMEM
ncbi:hypothetical protein ACUL41_17770 [Virgibacillus natechei]